MAVRIVDGTFTPGEPTIVAPRPGARDILDPATTRERLIDDLEMLVDKQMERPWRKHGNIPL